MIAYSTSSILELHSINIRKLARRRSKFRPAGRHLNCDVQSVVALIGPSMLDGKTTATPYSNSSFCAHMIIMVKTYWHHNCTVCVNRY